ncbi:MAG: tetratricopeptide repeat protein [Candidatus Omnitrophica bacterium]|nr:tetratricopeptide repeat protein [Candidatus Omnitrophota bacterium]
MKKIRAVIAVLVLFSGILYLAHRLEGSSVSDNPPPFFYVPPFQYVNTASGSFRVVCADIFYIRAILSVSESGKGYLEYILDNLRLAVSLDSRLTSAYLIGGIVAPRGKAEIPPAIRFLKESMERRPGEWKIPFWIAFNYYQLGDYGKAAEFYEKAFRLPEAPRYLKGLISFSYYQSGQAEMGVNFLEGLRASVKDRELLKQIDRKLKWLKNIVFLEEKVSEFERVYARLPKDLEELVSSGVIQVIPEDSFGQGYYIVPYWNGQRNEGRVRSKLPQ